LNLAYFIAKRISQQQKAGFSATIHKIAIVSICVGLAAAIVSFLIMHGFQEAVKKKMYSFSGHLVVNALSYNNSLEETPFSFNIPLYNDPTQFDGVQQVQEYAHKTGLLKTEDEILGVVVKGVSKRFDTLAFDETMVEGRFIHFPDSATANEVVVSRLIANKMKLKVGDEMLVHFFQNPPRFRKLTLTGIYETNLSEYFDGKMIISDLRMVQRLNDWGDSIAGGLEVYVRDVSQTDVIGQNIHDAIDYDLQVTSTAFKYQQVFQWLGLINRQVNILLVIILTVICINMISIVLILVMERTQMIGILKAMGATNKLIRNIFISNGINLVMRGLFWGNILGLSLCYIQYQFRLIPLNAHDYYIAYVPIAWHWDVILLLNLLMFTVVSFVLLLPTAVIARINPIKAIKFD
jgi:lipoprotein-releasing system permease protein